MVPLLRLLAIAIVTIVCVGASARAGQPTPTTPRFIEVAIALGAGWQVAPKTTHQVRDHESFRPIDVAEVDLDDDDDKDDDTDHQSDDLQDQLVAINDIHSLHSPTRSFFFGAETDTSRFAARPGLPRGPPHVRVNS